MRLADKHTKGFTLIELLVVIAIVGILSTVAMTSLNGGKKRARDSRRQAEIENIQKALEMYYEENGYYPLSNGAAAPNVGWSNSNSGASWSALKTALAPYMDLPLDPTNSPSGWAGTSNTYTYTYYSRGTGRCNQQWYMLVYRLESVVAASPGVRSCNGGNYAYPGTITVGYCRGC